jgi:hypothetical protein
MQNNHKWYREGQQLVLKSSVSHIEVLIKLSRTTLGGEVKHYAVDHQGNDYLFYEKDIN